MQVVEIQDADDPQLADYVSLTDVALRRVQEPASGLFIAESAEVLRRALGAGCAPRSVLLDPARVEELRADLEAIGGLTCYVATQQVLRAVTGYRVHRGVLAAMHRPRQRTVREVLSGIEARTSRIVVLEDLVDHTNVGAAFRSVAALGADAVLLGPRCADPLYRRSVRVSMGTVFSVPWARSSDWPADLDLLRAQGFVVAALALASDSVPLDAFVAPARLALVLGAEGDGLSPRAVAACDVAVRIPMSAGVDSLNVAAACAVALWAVR